MNTDKNLKIKNIDQKNAMKTYNRFDVVIKEGKKAVAKDYNNKEYIDVSSGIGVNSLGFSDDGFIKAVTNQLNKVQHISNYYYNEQPALLAEKLCKASNLKRAFLCNSGAEANECAIKIARKYSFDKYGPGRDNIITLKNSFHGRTITTLSATGQEVFHNYFFPFTEGFKYVEPEDVQKLKEAVDEKTCGIMIECIQGEGGVNILTSEYINAIAEICKEKDILFIIDEIQTGIGRTGSFFCYEQYNIKPDIITLAKGLAGGLPIGACLCNEKLEEVLVAGTHGTTFGGNPTSCAGANYVVDTVNKEEFLNSVKEKGLYFAKKLKNISKVKTVGHKGLMIGIELKENNAGEIAKKCVENGLLIITAKEKLRMLPPLNITYEEIDKAINILEKTLMEV